MKTQSSLKAEGSGQTAISELSSLILSSLVAAKEKKLLPSLRHRGRDYYSATSGKSDVVDWSVLVSPFLCCECLSTEVAII